MILSFVDSVKLAKTKGKSNDDKIDSLNMEQMSFLGQAHQSQSNNNTYIDSYLDINLCDQKEYKKKYRRLSKSQKIKHS